jgi:hypothetical protein
MKAAVPWNHRKTESRDVRSDGQWQRVSTTSGERFPTRKTDRRSTIGVFSTENDLFHDRLAAALNRAEGDPEVREAFRSVTKRE